MKPIRKSIFHHLPIVPSRSIPGITKPMLSINFEFEPGQFLVLSPRSPAGHSPAEEHDRCEDHSGAFAPSGFRGHLFCLSSLPNQLCAQKNWKNINSENTDIRDDYIPSFAGEMNFNPHLVVDESLILVGEIPKHPPG